MRLVWSCLRQLNGRSKRHVVMSIPHRAYYLHIELYGSSWEYRVKVAYRLRSWNRIWEWMFGWIYVQWWIKSKLILIDKKNPNAISVSNPTIELLTVMILHVEGLLHHSRISAWECMAVIGNMADRFRTSRSGSNWRLRGMEHWQVAIRRLCQFGSSSFVLRPYGRDILVSMLWNQTCSTHRCTSHRCCEIQSDTTRIQM